MMYVDSMMMMAVVADDIGNYCLLAYAAYMKLEITNIIIYSHAVISLAATTLALLVLLVRDSCLWVI